MARVSEERCYLCNAKTMHINDRCTACSRKQHEKEEARWKAMTMDEKLDHLRWMISQLQPGRLI